MKSVSYQKNAKLCCHRQELEELLPALARQLKRVFKFEEEEEMRPGSIWQHFGVQVYMFKKRNKEVLI